MAKKTTEKLTVKEKEFVKTLAKNGGNGTKAALKAYDTKKPRRAAAIASKKLKSPKIQTALEKELQKQGITLERALQPISKALVATKNENGSVVDDIEVQLKGSDRALKLLLPKEKSENNLNFNFNIDSARFGGEFVVEGGVDNE